MSPNNLSLEERRKRLERRAEVIRSRLLRTVDALDARRHQVRELGRRARKGVSVVASVLVGAGILLGGSVALIGWGLARRRRARLGYRVSRALEPFRAERRPAFGVELARRLLTSVATIVLSEVARRSTKNALEGRLPSGARPRVVEEREPPRVGG